MCDSEVETSYASIIGISFDPRFYSLSDDQTGQKIIFISDNSDLERVSRDSLGEETSSSS